MGIIHLYSQRNKKYQKIRDIALVLHCGRKKNINEYFQNIKEQIQIHTGAARSEGKWQEPFQKFI